MSLNECPESSIHWHGGLCWTDIGIHPDYNVDQNLDFCSVWLSLPSDEAQPEIGGEHQKTSLNFQRSLALSFRVELPSMRVPIQIFPSSAKCYFLSISQTFQFFQLRKMFSAAASVVDRPSIGVRGSRDSFPRESQPLIRSKAVTIWCFNYSR